MPARFPTWSATRLAAAMLAALLCIVAPLAHAAFKFEQVYSNLDGTVQFIVLHDADNANGLQGLHGGTILSSGSAGPVKSYTFTNDLPSSQTADKRVLIGTRGFAALSLVVPDYVIPDQFVPTGNGLLSFAGATDPNTVSFDHLAYQGFFVPGQNPTDALYVQGTVAVVFTNNATNFAGASAQVPFLPITVVEYYAPSLDHYFITALQAEIDALDTGAIPGWRRTGFSFKAYPAQPVSGPAVSPVCRFLIPPNLGNSHFISASPAECAALLQKVMTDPLYSGYIEETSSAFFIALPDINTGACPAGTISVYRLWNQRADSNHRYTTDAAIKAQMILAGYTAEGYGPNAVDMCAVDASVASALTRASGPSPFTPGCDGVSASGILYVNAEVEPMVAINPRNPKNIVGVWQQDRWSDGGAPGQVAGASLDGGQSWSASMAAFSRCSGGTPANGGDYPRVSDPWVSAGPDGTMHQSAIAFAGSTSAVLVSRSVDGGKTWSKPATLIFDTNAFFNDKDSIAADPTDANYVYAVWDRLTPSNTGPAYFARSIDGGLTWQPAASLYDPGPNRQTLNNQIVVLPDGTLIDFFTRFDPAMMGGFNVSLQIVRSSDKGLSWSGPITIAAVQSVGTANPATGAGVRDGSALGSIAVGPRGELAVTWQDVRFSQGAFDAIAFSRSLDGGLTWSPMTGVNANTSVAAWQPAVSYRPDGTVAVSYYDFRSGGASVSALPTDYWITQSGDGIVWRERHVSGPFDLLTAPVSGGIFLGDYQGLASYGETFVPFFVQTNSGNTANRTDVFASINATVIPAAAQSPIVVARRGAIAPTLSPELQQRARDNAARVLQRRLNRGG